VITDPKKAARAALYVARNTGADDDHAPMHTPHHPAVAELKHLLTMHRDELRRMKGKTQYAAIDAIMKRISREHGIAPSKLHDDWMSVYRQTPDAWVAGDHGNVVDRALKMTSRGGYAFGGAPDWNETTYKGEHSAPGPDNGSPMHDVTGVYPEDVYGPNGFRYYGDQGNAYDFDAFNDMKSAKGRPYYKQTIYRAVPKDKSIKDINPGDWVAINMKYAKDHGESALNGNYKILKKAVNARDLFTSGDSHHEWGYHPQPSKNYNERIEETNAYRQKFNMPLVEKKIFTPPESKESVVDRALKMTSRGGYAFGGAPAGFATATGAPINFAPAAGAFTGLPSPESLNLAPSKATMAAILASRPTTRMGSGEPVKFSPYVPPSISAPTFNASLYNLPKNEVSEGGQGGSGDRWHPNGGGAPTGGTAEIAAAAAAAAGPLGGGYGDSDAAARGGRIHRADGGEAYKDPESRKMAGWDWRPLGEVQEQLGDLREIPSHVVNFGQFMDETARRAATHGLTPRDLIKAYTITRSSIQRESRSADKARASGVPIPHDFTGSVRPEGAFGEWLHSPMGRRYLDAAEKGIVDHESIADASNVMKPFGLSTEAKALPWAAQNLPQHAAAVSDMVSRAMQRKSSPEEWRHFIGGVHGIGSAKAGFMASLLGRGDQPTLDARQVVLHTGNPTSEAKKPLARAGSEAVDRLAARQEAMGLKAPEGMEPYYQHLAHHAVWDKVGDEQTTHQDVINAMRHAATGGAIEDPAHSHPLAQAMAEIGLPMGDSRIHRADGKKNMFRRGGSVVDHALSLTRHTALHGMQPKRGRP
jgi:hypothetical protein